VQSKKGPGLIRSTGKNSGQLLSSSASTNAPSKSESAGESSALNDFAFGNSSVAVGDEDAGCCPDPKKFTSFLTVEHPRIMVNGTKDPVRTILRPATPPWGQPLTNDFRMTMDRDVTARTD
jgi:hypothetical protein